jgi:predicted HicB family RNase H-like nuclease
MTEDDPPKSRTFSIRLPINLLKRLRQLAKEEGRSVNNFINHKLEKTVKGEEEGKGDKAERE